ncbi:UNC93-like protein MFSD11 [Mytilus californianus]|uniref:UNC93-like protein MFSD11 n=1 Tax=Mytilus californianus TaxID=6549 RepID=UPI002247A2FB|nr:UNC93-like protein MFSD11 [Mytilus californianus]
MAAECDIRLYNIVMLGIAFMLLFTAFQTSSMAEQSVISSAKADSKGTFNGDGYTSLCIIYVVFSLGNWIAPPVVDAIGPKITMLIGAVMYCLFILQFLKPMTWALYLGSVLVGFGAAILWTAQGNFLTINSDSDTVARNSGIFWALLQCSLLFGNIYSYFVLKGSANITSGERTKLYTALSGAAVAGTLCFLFLRNKRTSDVNDLVNLPKSTESSDPSLNTESSLNIDKNVKKDSPLQSIVRSFHLLKTREMLLLSVAIAYTGIELTFFSGVYGTCISNNAHFGDEAKGLLGISGMFIGAGEILGGGIFGLFGKRTNRHGRDPIVVLGYILHMAAFFLIFINLPSESPLKLSNEATYLVSNKYIAILCSFLLGFGDSSFNTQLYSILGFMFPEDSSPAFALFKFVQSIAAAAGFFYSDYLILQWQLLILVVLGTVGTYCFCLVEWGSNKAVREGYQTI